MCCALHSLEIQSAAQMKSCVVMVSCSCLMRGHCGGHCHDPRELLRAWRCIFEADPRRTENTVAGVCQMSGGGGRKQQETWLVLLVLSQIWSFDNFFFFVCEKLTENKSCSALFAQKPTVSGFIFFLQVQKMCFLCKIRITSASEVKWPGSLNVSKWASPVASHKPSQKGNFNLHAKIKGDRQKNNFHGLGKWRIKATTTLRTVREAKSGSELSWTTWRCHQCKLCQWFCPSYGCHPRISSSATEMCAPLLNLTKHWPESERSSAKQKQKLLGLDREDGVVSIFFKASNCSFFWSCNRLWKSQNTELKNAVGRSLHDRFKQHQFWIFETAQQQNFVQNDAQSWEFDCLGVWLFWKSSEKFRKKSRIPILVVTDWISFANIPFEFQATWWTGKKLVAFYFSQTNEADQNKQSAFISVIHVHCRLHCAAVKKVWEASLLGIWENCFCFWGDFGLLDWQLGWVFSEMAMNAFVFHAELLTMFYPTRSEQLQTKAAAWK